MRKPTLNGGIFAGREFLELKNSQNFNDKLSQITSNDTFREN